MKDQGKRKKGQLIGREDMNNKKIIFFRHRLHYETRKIPKKKKSNSWKK